MLKQQLFNGPMVTKDVIKIFFYFLFVFFTTKGISRVRESTHTNCRKYVCTYAPKIIEIYTKICN